MSLRPTADRHSHPTIRGYAPRTPNPALLWTIELITAAAGGDRAPIYISTIQKWAALRFNWKVSRRTICYHLKAAIRDHLIARQSRWIAVTKRTELRDRSIYRLTWRHFQRLGRAARRWAQLARGVVAPGRRETVQKSAQGVQDLLRSVVPQAPPLRSGA